MSVCGLGQFHSGTKSDPNKVHTHVHVELCLHWRTLMRALCILVIDESEKNGMARP